jgi:hypothetical protein
VKAWQKHNGLEVTGSVDAGQLVFGPEPVRINRAIRVGTSFTGIEVTGSTPVIVVDTSGRDRSWFGDGAEVVLLGSDGSTAPVAITGRKQVTGDDGSRVWRTELQAVDAADLEPGRATVAVSDVKEADALLVPTSALLALAEGGFAVEKFDGDDTTLVGVELVNVLDSQAAVGGDVDEGDRLVVPS